MRRARPLHVFTGYTGTSRSDKSGNGDNDFVTLPFQTVVADHLVSLATPATPSTVAGLNGAPLSCATTGPQGGGPGLCQALRDQDYHARFNTQAGSNTVTVDAIVDRFGGIYSRSLPINPATNNGFYGPSYENVIKTFGLLVSDDRQFAKNDVGFGYYTQTQNVTGTTNQPQTDPVSGNVTG